MNKLLVKNAKEIVTCSGFKAKKGKEMSELKIINDGSVVIEDGIIKDLGKSQDILKKYNEDEYSVIDATNRSILPGFVDSHTHFIFGGYRPEEFSWRLSGMSYMEIMNKGGGIVNTVEATKEASLKELVKLGRSRLDSMLSFGVTTVEGKSGYGLDLDTELKQLEAMKELDKNHSIDIVKTFLGAHAVPKNYKGKEDKFINFIIKEVLPVVAERELAEFCDIFCEKNVFNIGQSRKLLLEAKKYNMKIKLHADEIIQLGGAELAAELGAISADHLLMASEDGIRGMAKSNVVATLLPGTAFSLKENYAKGRHMIDENCAVALATDFNPGSCFTESIPLIIALAALYMSMTPEEIISALTINGAAAIDRADKIGSIDIGKKGDLIILAYPSYKFLPYHIGVNCVEAVIKSGKVVVGRENR